MYRKYLSVVFIVSFFINSDYLYSQDVLNKVDDQFISVKARKKLYINSDAEYTEYESFNTRTIGQIPDLDFNKSLYLKNKYSSSEENRIQPTGFFHVKKIGNRWWGVDPEGFLHFNIGVNSINQGTSKISKKILTSKYGDDYSWIVETIYELKKFGFNCAGSWSNDDLIREFNKNSDEPFSYTKNWSFLREYSKNKRTNSHNFSKILNDNPILYVLEPGFEVSCENFGSEISLTREDPNLFGHFSDNEIPFLRSTLDVSLGLPRDNYAYIFAMSYLDSIQVKIENITNFERDNFVEVLAEKYYSIVSTVIKKYDPNHIYLGSRLYAREKDSKSFIQMISKYVDVISINYYGAWTPDINTMNRWEIWSGKPFLISEFYAKGEDSKMDNLAGAGFIVKTQKERGLFYQNFTLGLLESKNCIGFHHFKYLDNDSRDKTIDVSRRSINTGLYTIEYEPWQDALDEIKVLNNNVYKIIEYFDNY